MEKKQLELTEYNPEISIDGVKRLLMVGEILFSTVTNEEKAGLEEFQTDAAHITTGVSVSLYQQTEELKRHGT